jgi:hypothetical protein
MTPTHSEVFASSRIKSGQTYWFHYPDHFSNINGHLDHRGQQVTVIGPCPEEEADIIFEDDVAVDCLFRIQAKDGWAGQAWESELLDQPIE